jgi:hypothetical protein
MARRRSASRRQFHVCSVRWRSLRIFGALLGAMVLGGALNIALSILAPPA